MNNFFPKPVGQKQKGKGRRPFQLSKETEKKYLFHHFLSAKKMDHVEENLDERQEDEVEALKSIYDCDFDDLRKHDGVVHQILSPISNQT